MCKCGGECLDAIQVEFGSLPTWSINRAPPHVPCYMGRLPNDRLGTDRQGGFDCVCRGHKGLQALAPRAKRSCACRKCPWNRREPGCLDRTRYQSAARGVVRSKPRGRPARSSPRSSGWERFGRPRCDYACPKYRVKYRVWQTKDQKQACKRSSQAKWFLVSPSNGSRFKSNSNSNCNCQPLCVSFAQRWTDSTRCSCTFC